MTATLTAEEALDEFRAAGALLEGHFILSSGLHSPVFLQKMFVFQDPTRTERLCRALAEKARAAFGPVDIVASPALGGIVIARKTSGAAASARYWNAVPSGIATAVPGLSASIRSAPP